MTGNHRLIYRIAELMLQKQHNRLLVDSLFDDIQIGDFVKSIQIDSPYQQALLEGFISELVIDNRLYVGFTVEGYFHYVLGEVIYNSTKHNSPDTLKNLIEKNKLNGVKEGVEQCLIREVYERDFRRLIWLVDECNNSHGIALIPFAIALIIFPISSVLDELLATPSLNDLILLGNLILFFDNNLKTSYSNEIRTSIQSNAVVETLFLKYLKSKDINQVRIQFKIIEDLQYHISKENVQILIKHFQIRIEKLISCKTTNYNDVIEWISFLNKLNELDLASHYFAQLVQETEKKRQFSALALALESLGKTEYSRSNKDGYIAAIKALQRAAEIRESESKFQSEILSGIYKMIGFAYLSNGLQVVESIQYFEKARSVILNESTDTDDLAEINLYLGLVYYWRGLRGTGRWGNVDESLLSNLKKSPFDIAIEYYNEALKIRLRKLGKIHPHSIKVFHYLQETSYCVGNYEEALPSLRQYVNILPFKDPDHTDNYYRYCLIVALEEFSKICLAKMDKVQALKKISEALDYAKDYDKNNQIHFRLMNVMQQIESGVIKKINYSQIEDLPPLENEKTLKASWKQWHNSDVLKGFNTNVWMTALEGIWFFNSDLRQLIFWDKKTNLMNRYEPADWPAGCGRFVFDGNSKIFYAWSSIRSDVFLLTNPEGRWIRLSSGVHDVHACGASFGYDPEKNRLFEFGGYGYFTYKNWLWVFDLDDRKWSQLVDNRPGIMPYPRNGQILPIRDRTCAILISGIGSDTGIQREHKARMGLPSATDVGYFTWLRDAYWLDLKTMEWTALLVPNHESIRHEGAFGYLETRDLVLNWSGTIPAAKFGKEPVLVRQLSCWKLSEKDGFKMMEFYGAVPPLTGGYFQSIPSTNQLLYIHPDNIWTLTVYDR